MDNRNKKFAVLSWGVLLLFIIDRLTKLLALRYLDSAYLPFLKYFRLELLLNKGIMFSIDFPVVFIYAFNIIILLAVFYFLVSAFRKNNITSAACLALVAVGAISNLLDRIYHGGVVDFINLRIMPVFNLADLMILTGALMLVFDYFSKEKKNEKIHQNERGF